MTIPPIEFGEGELGFGDKDSFGHETPAPSQCSLENHGGEGAQRCKGTRAERAHDGAGIVERAGDGARNPGRRGCAMVRENRGGASRR